MEENLNELIKTDNATILTLKNVKQAKPIESKIIKPKPVSGTKEWADRNENCLDGCSHDCKYCYAKAMAVWAVRFIGSILPPSLPLDAETQSIGMSASAHQAGGGIWTGLKVEHCWPAIGGN